MHFSLIPLNGKVIPYKDIPPVIAKSYLTHLEVNRETNAKVIVTPALGPSFGLAANGK